MKRTNDKKKIFIGIILGLMIVMNGLQVQPQVGYVQAATVKMSTSGVNLTVGQTKKLSVKNTKKKATWTSGSKRIATVSKNGKVKAVGQGTTTITAKVGSNKYFCKVTVREVSASEKLKKTYEAIKKAYGDNYMPNMKFDTMTLDEVIGLKSNLYDTVIAEGPMMSFSVDTLICVQAKKGKGAEVEKALNSYRNYLIHDAFQYPSNMPKINASKIVREGDFVFFVLLGKANDDETDENKLLSYYQKQNEIAVKEINAILGGK